MNGECFCFEIINFDYYTCTHWWKCITKFGLRLLMCKNAGFRSTWIGTRATVVSSLTSRSVFEGKQISLGQVTFVITSSHGSPSSNFGLGGGGGGGGWGGGNAATTLLKVVSHPPQLSPPTIRSINARRRSLCLSCWGVYALRVTAVTLFSFLSPSLFHSHPTDDNESLKLQYAVKIGPRSL